MAYSNHRKDILFDGAAHYRIAVIGRIDELWVENLGGMEARYQNYGSGAGMTFLTGQLKDQAELIGVLNSIYELHLPIFSVGRDSFSPPLDLNDNGE